LFGKTAIVSGHGSVRFSLGDENTEADVDRVLEVLPGIVAKLRAMSPLNKDYLDSSWVEEEDHHHAV